MLMKVSKYLIAMSAFLLSTASLAVNPIVQTIYTADPAPMIYKDKVYIYTGRDEDGSTWFTMKEWRCYSSSDMVNWTDHGPIASLATFKWAKADAWAAQAIERDGKFYLYVPVNQNPTATGKEGMALGVAVADSPTGPFKDALGHPLVFDTWGDIDPSVFVDDDGQAYLYWGNPDLKYAKLNKDMVSIDTRIGNNGVVRVPLTVESFGERTKTDRATSYEEGPWPYKRNGLYYMMFAGGPVPEHLAYSTGPTATGPWTYRGIIMPTQGGSFTNHGGIIDFKGHSYLVYHNGALPGGGGFTRSASIEEFKYNADGSIPTINMTSAGVNAVASLDPYQRTEAETIAWESGVETARDEDGTVYVHDIDDGDYIRVMNVDFTSSGASSFNARVQTRMGVSLPKDAAIELHLDSVDGPLVGMLPLKDTRGKWRSEKTTVKDALGTHDLFFVFKGNDQAKNVLKFDSWQFTKKVEKGKPGE
eukprot:TRINITY_DN1045_c0_g1_i4.p1 TRINITY_DN1045_c0_g1~~TRINITY_DN1045_c0_g1_i4.p1  ORF type:complete len:475 (+),score=115.18 TRINITY_DN1045_c0_g1_i4:950-2374(+)